MLQTFKPIAPAVFDGSPVDGSGPAFPQIRSVSTHFPMIQWAGALCPSPVVSIRTPAPIVLEMLTFFR